VIAAKSHTSQHLSTPITLTAEHLNGSFTIVSFWVANRSLWTAQGEQAGSRHSGQSWIEEVIAELSRAIVKEVIMVPIMKSVEIAKENVEGHAIQRMPGQHPSRSASVYGIWKTKERRQKRTSYNSRI